MRFSCLLPVLALWLAAPLAAEEPEQTPDKTPEAGKEAAQAAEGGGDSARNVVFFAPDRPLFLRVHVEMGGKGLDQAWETCVRETFAFCDKDNSGTLSQSEANTLAMLGVGVGIEVPGERGIIGSIVSAFGLGGGDKKKDAGLKLDDFRRQFGASSPPFTVTAVAQQQQVGLDLFAALDADGDSKLSPRELTRGLATLHKLDLDDNESISQQELGQYANPFASSQFIGYSYGSTMLGTFSNADTPLVDLAEHRFRAAARTRLLRQYAGNDDEQQAEDRGPRLRPKELGFSACDVKKFDADADGLLDAAELDQLLAEPPAQVELAIRLGERGEKPPVEVLSPPEKQYPPGTDLVDKNGRVSLASPLARIQVRASGDGMSFDTSQFYLQQFDAADQDNNKYLDAEECQSNGTFNGLFDLIDRDGDEKLFAKEIKAFFRRQESVNENRATLTVTDRGRPMFETLDADGDGRLTEREFRGAAGYVQRWDRDGDGKLAEDEFPHNYSLAFSQGYGYGQIEGFTTVIEDSFATGPLPVDPADGPAWFARMDRNLDGDVSRREFLGPLPLFDKLDANGDELIDRTEAAKAE